MAVVVIGPSSVGKSTLLHSPDRDKYIDSAYTELIFGHELKRKPIAATSIIHYNMLKEGYRRYGRLIFRSDMQRWQVINQTWDFNTEPVFAKIFATGMIDHCLVLVAPRQELIERIRAREISEINDSSEYPSDFWFQAITQLHLNRIYEQLFDTLEQRAVPYTVYFSSNTVEDFASTDRVHVHACLEGRFAPLPDKKAVESIANSHHFQYQSVRLPYGITTAKHVHKLLPADKDSFLKSLLPKDLVGASILDVGSAMGGLLFLAERMGAGRMVGIELDQERYAASRTLAELLRSKAEFFQADFLDFDNAAQFDHVFLLNVIHHVNGFYGFIRKAAQSCRKTLTIEFPTLSDNRFTGFHKLSQTELMTLNHLPLIGISSDTGAGQTFVYSPAAIKHLVMSEIGGFSTCEARDSTIKERAVLTFSRKS